MSSKLEIKYMLPVMRGCEFSNDHTGT